MNDPADLIRDYSEAQAAAVLEIADQGLLSLAQLVESGAIDVAPQFQRRDRWNPTKQSRLIESFLTNIPVPPVYLAEDSSRLGHYAIIDGKQRLTAVATFFADRLVLRGLTRLSGLNGLSYSGMPLELRNSLGMKNLRTTTLLRQSNEELKHEVFLRLNTGGEILNAQEIRNVAYRGPLNDLIYELSKNELLRRQFKITEKPMSSGYRQMTDAEYVLRFLTLANNWLGFQGEMRLELDRFMAEHRLADPSELENFSEDFNRCIVSADAIWGVRAFKRPGRDQALAGLFDAQMVALKELDAPAHRRLVQQRASAQEVSDLLFDDEEFDEAVRLGTNTPSRLKYRIERMLQVLHEVAS